MVYEGVAVAGTEHDSVGSDERPPVQPRAGLPTSRGGRVAAQGPVVDVLTGGLHRARSEEIIKPSSSAVGGT